MNQQELAILDRESRIAACWASLVALLSPIEAVRKQAKSNDLIEFIAEEYDKARQEMRRSAVPAG